jgi:hemin uptake protein HemP
MNPVLNVVARPELLTLESTRLFAIGREVRIRHCGEEYRLRLTSNNKLILTK